MHTKAFLIYNATTFAISLLKDSVCPHKIDFFAVFGRLELVCESNKNLFFSFFPILVENRFKVFQFLGIVSLLAYRYHLSVLALALKSVDFSSRARGGKQWCSLQGGFRN